MNRLTTRASTLLTLVVILAVAAILRFWALGSLPFGLYRDEAFNGLDALNVLRGDFALYFAANNGREPIFIYLIAASVGVLGRTPLAARLPAAFASLLTVPALYLMARELWGRRVGLISAAVLAVTLWPVHLAHVSFRAVLLPLFLALTVWQAARGWQSGHKKNWLAAGALYGLSFYTYLAVRFTPLVVGLVAGYVWLTFLRPNPQARRRALLGASWFIIAAVLIILPLLLYTCFHWDIVMGRVGQASVLNPAISGGNLPGTLLTNTLKALGMFFVQGDRIYRHNVPWRPVFDPAIGLCFAVGIILALRQARANAGAGLALLWTAVMLLPTILAEDSPHFLRAAGVLPVIAVFPALALEALIQKPGFLKKPGFLLGVLLISLSSTVYDYFIRYPLDPKTAYWFDSAGVSLAREAQDALNNSTQVMIDHRLWNDWANLRFMLAKDQVNVFDPSRPTTPESGAALWLVWPFDDWPRMWPALLPQAQIEIRQGALYQGDKDQQAHPAYLSLRASPYSSLPQPVAQFEQGIQLLEAKAVQGDGGVNVRLVWRTESTPAQPFIVFVHLLQDGQRVAQGDSAPAGGYYPAQVWRPGDVIVDEHQIDWTDFKGNEQVLLGLYIPEADQRLNVLDAAGQPAADSITLNIK